MAAEAEAMELTQMKDNDDENNDVTSPLNPPTSSSSSSLSSPSPLHKSNLLRNARGLQTDFGNQDSQAQYTDILINVLGTVMYLIDLIIDIVLAMVLFINGDVMHAGITAVIIVVACVANIVATVWNLRRDGLAWYLWIAIFPLLLFNLAPVLLTSIYLYHGRRSTKVNSYVTGTTKRGADATVELAHDSDVTKASKRDAGVPVELAHDSDVTKTAKRDAGVQVELAHDSDVTQKAKRDADATVELVHHGCDVTPTASSDADAVVTVEPAHDSDVTASSIMSSVSVTVTAELKVKRQENRDSIATEHDRHVTKRDNVRACVSRLVQACLEAASQSVFQLTVLLTPAPSRQRRGVVDVWRAMSLFSSWLTLTMALATFDRAMRNKGQEKPRGLAVFGLECVWRLLEVGSRVVCMAVFETVFQNASYIVLVTHAMMVVPLVRTKENAGRVSSLVNYVTSCSLSLLAFSPFVLDDQARDKFYFLFHLENVVMLLLWYFLTPLLDVWYHHWLLLAVLAAIVLHLALQHCYYLMWPSHGQRQTCGQWTGRQLDIAKAECKDWTAAIFH